MKYLFLLILFCLQGSNLFASNRSEDYVAQVDSLLKINNIADIELICNSIADSDSVARNHKMEVELVKLAIDYMQPEALLLFYESKIGQYDAAVDSITPIEYFFDDNFEKRISDQLSCGGDQQEVSQKIFFTFHILLAFQPINDKIVELTSLRLLTLADIWSRKKCIE